MKKFIIGFFAIVAFGLVGCNNDFDDSSNSSSTSKDKNAIQFTMSSTRAQYDDTDKWYVRWNSAGTDEIRIYSYNAEIGGDGWKEGGVSANYKITNVGKVSDTDIRSTGDITAIGDSYLKWSQITDPYDFFAVYPADDKHIAKYDFDNNQVEFYYNAEQVVTATADASGNYVAKPDEKSIYMLATANDIEYGKTVSLEFDPILTALEITVNGLEATQNKSVEVIGVSIVAILDKQYVSDDAKIKYDVTNNKLLSYKDNVENTQTIYIRLSSPVTLTGTNKLTVTAMVPPVDLTSANSKILVHTAGNTDFTLTGTMSISMPKTIPAGYKALIELPNMKAPFTNNWITPLDGNIYVNQLSIPGTHDAATGKGTSLADAGQTQMLTIENQLVMGIRAFDIRPCLSTTDGSNYSSGDETQMNVFHGFTKTEYTFEQVMDAFVNYLSLYPNEFIIMPIRRETDQFKLGSLILAGGNKDVDGNRWNAAMQNILEKYNGNAGNTTTTSTTFTIGSSTKTVSGVSRTGSIVVDFDSKMTIEDCRGKILILGRESESISGVAKPLYGANVSWLDLGHTTVTMRNNKDVTNTLYFQDLYKPDSGMSNDSFLSTKTTYIKETLNQSSKFVLSSQYPKSNTTFPWAINHTSGYTSALNLGGVIKIDIGSTSSYQSNAATQNQAFYNYVTDVDDDYSDDTKYTPGPMGIIMMDWAGARRSNAGLSGGSLVYGDLLPQIIISNNYRYRMRRTTDAQ